jgi:hypothetical protein
MPNAYTLRANTTYFQWNNQLMSETQWKATGNDVSGTFAR